MTHVLSDLKGHTAVLYAFVVTALLMPVTEQPLLTYMQFPCSERLHETAQHAHADLPPCRMFSLPSAFQRVPSPTSLDHLWNILSSSFWVLDSSLTLSVIEWS